MLRDIDNQGLVRIWIKMWKLLFVYNFMVGCSEKNREDAFEWKKKKPGLNFNLGLAPIGLQTTRFALIFYAQKENVAII